MTYLNVRVLVHETWSGSCTLSSVHSTGHHLYSSHIPRVGKGILVIREPLISLVCVVCIRTMPPVWLVAATRIVIVTSRSVLMRVLVILVGTPGRCSISLCGRLFCTSHCVRWVVGEIYELPGGRLLYVYA